MLRCDLIHSHYPKILMLSPVPGNLHRNIIVILTPHRLTPTLICLTISHNLGLYLVHLLQSRQIQIWPPGGWRDARCLDLSARKW